MTALLAGFGLGFGVAAGFGPIPASVAAGTLTWFTIVSAGSAFAGRYAGQRALRVVSTVAAVTIAAFGGLFIAGGVRVIT